MKHTRCVVHETIEDGDSSAQSTVATKKKELRDAINGGAITNETIAELKSAWNTSLLGASPTHRIKRWVLYL